MRTCRRDGVHVEVCQRAYQREIWREIGPTLVLRCARAWQGGASGAWPRMGGAVELRGLRFEDEDEARAAHAELAAEGFAFLPFHEPSEPWDEYLERIDRLSRGDGLAPGFVPWTDLYGVVDGVIVGRVSVRHRLTEGLLQVGGHIGYGVRTAYRRRGYATELLRAGLGIARDLGIDRALVTCDDDNVGSAIVIERCGGELEDIRSAAGGSPKRRYWVTTTIIANAEA